MRYPVNYIAITNSHHYGKCLDFGWNSLHGGKNQPIYAVEDGVVYKTETQKGGGKHIFIEHSNGMCSDYGHLHKIYVKKGQKVKKGDKIALMGKTGTLASGNHLHFGLYKDVKSAITYKHSTIDPFDYLEVYSGQTVGKSTKEKYGNEIKYHKETKRVNSKNGLNVRNKPSILGKKVGALKNKTKVTIYETKNGWSKISKTEEKWVSSKYLK